MFFFFRFVYFATLRLSMKVKLALPSKISRLLLSACAFCVHRKRDKGRRNQMVLTPIQLTFNRLTLVKQHLLTLPLIHGVVILVTSRNSRSVTKCDRKRKKLQRNRKKKRKGRLKVKTKRRNRSEMR